MGLQHRKLPLWGVQFHPESICTQFGAELLGNFLALSDAHNASLEATLEGTHSNASSPPVRTHKWQGDDLIAARLSSASSAGSAGSTGSTASARSAHSRSSNAHCENAGAAVPSAPRARSLCGHSQLRLLHRVVDSRLEAETYYMAKLSKDERSFWLDSSRRELGMSRFSYMGGSTGPLSYQVRYNLPKRTLHTTFADGREESSDDCDVLDFLQEQLRACQLAAHVPASVAQDTAATELPFEFMGGFVGYLGYELKELCEDGVGEKNRHVSEEPDAVLLFADRFLVWDHQHGCVYVVALVSEDDIETHAAGNSWLESTEVEILRLSSLSLRETLAERHQAMREVRECVTHEVPPMSEVVPVRHAADSAPGGDASSEPDMEGAVTGTEDVETDEDVHESMGVGEERVSGNEPPTVDADDGEEQEPSNSPSGPGSISFPPVKPTAPLLSAGPGSVPRGALPHSEGVDSSTSAQGGGCGKDGGSKDLGFTSLDSEVEYQAKVRQCLGYIVEGESYELCLTTRHRSRRGMRVDALRFYQRLRAVNPAPYSALLRCGPGLTVCSSSPERFLRIRADGLCDSKPIKGTRRRGSCPVEDAAICEELRTCEKDLAENLMIVDLVRNDFGRVCTEASVCCPKIMDVETYATVHQLVSTIQGQMRADVTCIDVLRATFPMGSMTGAPKRRSLALLDVVEGDARGIYSGAVGFLSLDGAVHFSVAIRTAVVTDDRVKIGAGGAITVLSDPQDEWDEMLLKAAALLSCAHAVASGGVVQAPTITSTVASAGAAAGGSRVRGDGLAATPDTIFT